eukprot:SAG31_NODE_24137_length_488_cov_1.138817_1_plen_25_part_01
MKVCGADIHVELSMVLNLLNYLVPA